MLSCVTGDGADVLLCVVECAEEPCFVCEVVDVSCNEFFRISFGAIVVRILCVGEILFCGVICECGGESRVARNSLDVGFVAI